MRKVYTWVAALVVTAIVAGPALAQDKPRGFGGGFGGGKFFYLTQKSVQAELKLTEDQVKQAAEFQAKQRENRIDFQNLSREEVQAKLAERTKEGEKFLAGLLKPEQMKRLDQISYQQRGANAFSDVEVQKALGFTDEQRQKVEAIQKDGQAAMRDLFQPGGDFAEAAKKMEEFQKSQQAKLTSVLTAEQKTKWTELQGAKFEGKIDKPAFGKPRKPPVG